MAARGCAGATVGPGFGDTSCALWGQLKVLSQGEGAGGLSPGALGGLTQGTLTPHSGHGRATLQMDPRASRGWAPPEGLVTAIVVSGHSNGLGDTSSEHFLLTQVCLPRPSAGVAFKPHHRGGGLWGCWGHRLRERTSPWVATDLAGQTRECHCQHVTRIQERVRLEEKWGRVEAFPGPALPAPGITHAAQSLQAPGGPLL